MNNHLDHCILMQKLPMLVVQKECFVTADRVLRLLVQKSHLILVKNTTFCCTYIDKAGKTACLVSASQFHLSCSNCTEKLPHLVLSNDDMIEQASIARACMSIGPFSCTPER